MTGSNFSGALGILHPTSQANTNVAERGNLYGANGAQIDSSSLESWKVFGGANGFTRKFAKGPGL
jgi:hypothetical protein